MAVNSRDRFKKKLTKLALPFSGSSSTHLPQKPSTDLQGAESDGERPINSRSISNSSADVGPDDEITAYKGSGPAPVSAFPVISVSRPSTRSTASSGSVEFTPVYSPMRQPAGGMSGNGSVSVPVLSPSVRYLSTNGQDHQFLLSHGKSLSTGEVPAQLPIPVQPTSSYSSSLHSSISKPNSNSYSSNNISHLGNNNNNNSQTALPAITPIHHQNFSLNSLPSSMQTSFAVDIHNPVNSHYTLSTRTSSRGFPGSNPKSHKSSVNSSQLGGSGGGGLLRKKHSSSNAVPTVSNLKTKKQYISHKHPHHTPLKCPYIKQEFVDLESTFDQGMEMRIKQISDDNEMLAGEIASMSIYLDKLCEQMQDQIDNLDKCILELDSKSDVLNESRDKDCMMEDLNDLINRIDNVTKSIDEKKASIAELNIKLDHLAKLKDSNKVTNVKRKKLVLVMGTIVTVIFFLKLAFF